MYSSCMTTISVSEARATLPDVIDRVLAGEEVTLTRHGVAVAVVVHPESLQLRRATQALSTASAIHDVLVNGRRSKLTKKAKITPARAAALIGDIRASRSAR